MTSFFFAIFAAISLPPRHVTLTMMIHSLHAMMIAAALRHAIALGH